LEKNIRECIFCGSRPVTLEHVWGDWLNRKYKSYNPKARVSHRIINKLGGAELSDKRGRLDNSGSPFSKRHRAVCEKCNREWMSGIENQFIPIFERLQNTDSVILNVNDISSIRNWCYLKLIIQQSIWISDSTFTVEIRQIFSDILGRQWATFFERQVAPNDANLLICRAQPLTYGPGSFTYNCAVADDNGNDLHIETFSAALPNFGFVFFKNIPSPNKSLNKLQLATIHGLQAATFRALEEGNAPIEFPYNQQALDFNLAEIAVSIMNDLGVSHFKLLGNF
jgi:hypothetical protein